jgi:hypothetical protein
MRRCGMLLATLALVGAPDVKAETWKARIALIAEASARTCGEVPQVIWTLSLEAGTLSGTNNFGAKFSTPVAPDGAVNARYTGRVGGNETFEMVVTGNANTRHLEMFNAKNSCRYKVEHGSRVEN